jgi:hypothetical protein
MNSSCTFLVVAEADREVLTPGNAELYIFHQGIDQAGRTAALFNTLYKSESSVMMMIGGSTNLRQLAGYDVPIQFESLNGQWDDVTPVINSNFRDFGFSENSNGVFARYPPIDVPFGKFSYPSNANVILLSANWKRNYRPAAVTNMARWKS